VVDVHFIILAQGTQQRMGDAHGYKQLLPLPACGNVPIMMRTLRQVAHMYRAPASSSTKTPSCVVTIVAWNSLIAAVPPSWQGLVNCFTHTQLHAPGNSSLKGIARVLEDQGWSGALPLADSTVVLLGDVVYSWACLMSLANLAGKFGFVGTSDLSSSGGELWGVAWHRDREGQMLSDLRDGLLRHPPFDDTYQPGQLRRWLSGWRRGDVADHVAKLIRVGHYFAIDDYTMDVDLPAHIPLLGKASIAAAADDYDHGITWSTP